MLKYLCFADIRVASKFKVFYLKVCQVFYLKRGFPRLRFRMACRSNRQYFPEKIATKERPKKIATKERPKKKDNRDKVKYKRETTDSCFASRVLKPKYTLSQLYIFPLH